jgi:hypothetical protein
LTIIRFELIRLYEIQHSLRQLSYFDVFGRLRLTLQLARVTLSIPMAIDQAMKAPEAEDADKESEKPGKEEQSSQSAPQDAAASDDDDDGDSDEGDSSGEDSLPAVDDFGMRGEEGSSEEEGRAQRKKHNRKHRTKQRKRERLEEAEKAKEEEKALLQRGLLGPTTSKLLRGMVKVLETSEGWVPGRKADSDE